MKNLHLKKLIVTADDFGLDEQINRGIILAHRNGIVTSTSVLVHAPKSEEAFKHAKEVPSLEYGLHLAIVESLAFSNVHRTILADENYFNDGVCLIRSWKDFIPKFLLGKIALNELDYEFNLQFERFLLHFDSIPFINSTQHLHLLPEIQDLVLKLSVKYGVKSIRAPNRFISKNIGRKFLQRKVMQILSQRLNRKASEAGLVVIDSLAGFDVSGQLDGGYLESVFDELSQGTTELCTHPGLNSIDLKRLLPSSYGWFNWENELKALTAESLKGELDSKGIVLSKFVS